MLPWRDLLDRIPPALWVGVGAGSALLAVTSLALVPWVLVRLPDDFLVRRPPTLAQRLSRGSLTRRALVVVRNLVGIAVLLAGVLMLFVPGQGLLTIVAGLGLIDLPGRHALLVRVLAQPRVARAVDRLRARAGRPPLRPPTSTSPTSESP